MSTSARPSRSLALKFVLGGLVLLAALRLAQAAAQDDERSAWAYRRAIELDRPGPAFAACALPPELVARAQADLRDLRLLDATGAEVPFVVDLVSTQAPADRIVGKLVDVRREARRWSEFVVDLGRQVTVERLTLSIPDQDFAKSLRVEASNDSHDWRLVRRDAGVFDHAWGTRIHHTEVTLDEGISARYLRLTLDDRRSRTVDVVGVVATERPQVAGARWLWPVPISRQDAAHGVSRYRLELPPGFRFDRVQLACSDAAFARHVAVLDVQTQAGRVEERSLGQGVLYRLQVGEPALAGESLALDFELSTLGTTMLEIQDGDSPPLHNVQVQVGGPRQRLLFPVRGEPLVLYYGNPATRAPVYDLEALRSRLVRIVDHAEARLGPELSNPKHQPPAPLSFVAIFGGECETSRWRWRRPLVIESGTDIYTLRLTAQDVGFLRPDLGDLRIVAEREGERPQVPYLLEDDAAEERVLLQVARLPGPRQTTSRYGLKLPPTLESEPVLPLPLTALELDVAEPFFQRPVRVLVPHAHAGERVLYQGSLARNAHERGPLRIPLGAQRLAEALVEIDEGDNAPLTLRNAWAVLGVPRIVFKAAPGRYALISGNPAAAPPRYDLALLRRQLLAYSALDVKPAALEPNPSFRRPVTEYFSQAPPTAVLWIVIVGAVVVLTALTLRIVRRAAPDDGDSQAG